MWSALLLISGGWAWETDPLTDRDQPLADGTAYVDAFTSEIIDAAIERTNAALGCGADVGRARDVLARELFGATSKRKFVTGRGTFRGMGHGAFSAWLETAPELERRTFDGRTDMFQDVRFGESPILSSAGTCSLITLAGVVVGTDKPDHFWYNGYMYYLVAQHRNEPAAIDYGTKTELTYYGMTSSSTFSFADLHANWQGYRFFRGLLTEGSVVGRDAEGCLVRTAPFAWEDWVDWRWDEALNPNVYTPKVGAYVDERLSAHQDEVCADVAPILGDVQARLQVSLVEPTPWASGRAPKRVDPYHLAERCEAASADAPAEE